jgi:hypothetical protein
MHLQPTRCPQLLAGVAGQGGTLRATAPPPGPALLRVRLVCATLRPRGSRRAAPSLHQVVWAADVAGDPAAGVAQQGWVCCSSSALSTLSLFSHPHSHDHTHTHTADSMAAGTAAAQPAPEADGVQKDGRRLGALGNRADAERARLELRRLRGAGEARLRSRDDGTAQGQVGPRAAQPHCSFGVLSARWVRRGRSSLAGCP